MKILWSVLIAVFGVTLPVLGSGCRSDAQPKKLIGVSVLTLTHPFFIEITNALKAEAAKHGYDVLLVSGEFDVAKQGKQVEDFLVRHVDAIVLCPCDSKAIGPVIQSANAAGVPVFTVDIACLAPAAKVVTHVATDNLAGGKQAAQAMIELLGQSGGKIAIIDHKSVESCMLRVKGFKQVIEAHNQQPGSAKIEIVTELPGGGAKDLAYKAAEDLLQAHADLSAIFAINDPSALGARTALEKAGRAERVKIIGFDGQPEGKQAIRDGRIYADPIQYPQKLGHETAAVIDRYFRGEEVPKEILFETGLYRQADAAKELGSK
jgi:ribose transport system substrate-binding protein